MEKLKLGRYEIICPCGQHFFAWRCSIIRGGGKFCSKECSIKYKTKPDYHKIRINQWKNGNRILTPKCKRCGSFKGINHDCKKIANKLSIANSGERHWNWKGGITGRDYPKEFFNKIRDLIKERDKFICQRCRYQGNKGDNNLVTHHLDWNKKNCELNNLITLCRSCHAFEHNGKQRRY